MGFFLGSTPEPSIEMLRNTQQLRQKFGLPVCISVSRKSFLQNIIQKDARSASAATLAAEIYASLQGAEYIRTHDTAALNDALTVLARLWKK
jgi:dihydropteroate synthase